MTKLGRITFDGSEPGVVHDAMSEGRLADAWGTVEEGDTGGARHGLADPLHERGVVFAVNKGTQCSSRFQLRVRFQLSH